MRKFSARFVFVILCILLSSYLFTAFRNSKAETTNPASPVALTIPASLFHSGDLIFRDGRGIISNTFRRLSLKDPKYSHAGIIHCEGGNVFVYHIIGGEGSKINGFRKDRLTDFCSPFQSNGFAVYRSDLNGNSIDSLAVCLSSKKIQFDMDFDLKSDDRMYCTEFIYKILSKIAGRDNFITLTDLSGVRYVACDDIYLSPHSTKIFSYNYLHRQ